MQLQIDSKLKSFQVSPLEGPVSLLANTLAATAAHLWHCVDLQGECICVIWFIVCLGFFFYLICRLKHGDAGSPCTVAGGPELWPRNWSRCGELLWSSRVYVFHRPAYVFKNETDNRQDYCETSSAVSPSNPIFKSILFNVVIVIMTNVQKQESKRNVQTHTHSQSLL